MAKNKSVVIECWDNGGKTADRFTIAISGLMSVEDEPYTYFLGASKNPYHPQGVGQHSNEMPVSEYESFRGGWQHLGKRVMFTDLPEEVQKFVACELMPEGW